MSTPTMSPEEARYIAAHVRRSLTAAAIDLLRSPKSEIEEIITNAVLEGSQAWQAKRQAEAGADDGYAAMGMARDQFNR